MAKNPNILYEYTTINSNQLKPYEKNSRTHSQEQINQVIGSIKEFGFTNPLLIDENNNIIAGHCRLEAAKNIGIVDIPCVVMAGFSEAQRIAYVIADNQLALNAGWDMDILKEEAMKLQDMDYNVDMLGFDDDFIKELTFDQFEGSGDEDNIPEISQDIVVKNGDLWILGNHRLFCGDSCNSESFKILMNKNKADITFTSPPYNVGKTPNGNDKKYANDNDSRSLGEYLSLLNDFTKLSLEYSDYVFSNIQSLAGNKVALIEHLYEMKHNFSDTIIWDKGSAEPAMARKVLNSRFEYINIFSNEPSRVVGVRDFRGTIDNIFQMTSRKDKDFSTHHKATFPVSLVEKFICEFTESSVIDPFCGTGTSIIACEKNKRRCYGLELDPFYCDLSIKRWQEYANQEAILESSGQSYNEIVNERS